MENKEALAILGLLFSGNSMAFVGDEELSAYIQNDRSITCSIIDYLENLNLDYDFVKDILNDTYGSVFYHTELGMNSMPLPEKYIKEELYTSEHDAQIWVDENGRLGVWCEVDGFVAWLDEYQKVWIVDSREEVEERKRKAQEWFDKNISSKIEQCFDKVFKNSDGPIMFEKFQINGLSEYKAMENNQNDE